MEVFTDLNQLDFIKSCQMEKKVRYLSPPILGSPVLTHPAGSHLGGFSLITALRSSAGVERSGH